MTESLRRVALLHYSVPPVVGGVESVIYEQARFFAEAGYPTTIVAGRGKKDALPARTDLVQIPELDSQNPQILEMSHELDQGRVPPNFEQMVLQLAEKLAAVLTSIDVLLVHNVFSKHFNLPLTAALFRLLDQGVIQRCITWCHDITWTSPNSRAKVYPGYPWDLLRTYRSDLNYVTISEARQRELSGLLKCPPEKIRVIYNGVNPSELLALSNEGLDLINRLKLWESDLNLLMPVRVTQAKNIELALHVVASLKERGIDPKLVVTGPPDPHDQRNMEYFQSLLDLREQLGVFHQMRFVYELGPRPSEPLIVDMPIVAELLRVSDAVFMPSHREGFGMPILEAGLVGVPVFCAEGVPAGKEIGRQDVIRFAHETNADQVAALILKWVEDSSIFRMRKRLRKNLTWDRIFRREIFPLLNGGYFEGTKPSRA